MAVNMHSLFDAAVSECHVYCHVSLYAQQCAQDFQFPHVVTLRALTSAVFSLLVVCVTSC